MSADFWAGYLSGAASIVIGNPLDLIKVRMQAATTAAESSPSATNGPHRSPYSTLTDARTLLRGLPAPIFTYGALNALLYTSYNRSLALFGPPSDGTPTNTPHSLQYSYVAYFTAGAVAGLATFVISTPTELVKCRAQAAPLSQQNANTTLPTTVAPSSWAIARTTFRNEGIRGLYLGGTITAARDAVGYGFYFWTYEACKTALEAEYAKRYPVTTPQTAEAVKVLLAGGIAGIVTWASIYPLDVVKTRVQTQLAQDVVDGGAVVPVMRVGAEGTPLLRADEQKGKRYLGGWEVARRAYRNEGSGVFFRGLTICCVRAFIVSAAQWAVYEWTMEYLSGKGR